MPGVPREYLGMMRDAMKESTSSPSAQRPLKKRKKNKRSTRQDSADVSDTPEPQGLSLDQAIAVDGSEDENARGKTEDDLNSTTIIDLSDNEAVLGAQIIESEPSPKAVRAVSEAVTVDDNELDEDDDDEFDDDDFEDVDLESVKPRASSNLTGDVHINMDKEKPVAKKKVKAKNVIDREERIFRKNFHRNYIAIMAIHGFIRNRWCNNKTIHSYILKLIAPKVYDELHSSKNSDMPHIRTRRFLDGLRHLLDRWSKYYKVTSNKGIYKHDWYDWYGYEKSKVPFSRFAKCIAKGRGNRDIGAQGFVALLRAAGVPSRLVFSLQPPDFTSMAIKKKPEDAEGASKQTSQPKTAQEKLLELRKGNISTSTDKKTLGEVEMNYPVFWAEAWDSASKAWITIDPIHFKIIENIKSRSKLEPPANSPYNNLTYVIGYDRKGGVRDITKRYAEKYYARTRKKRITKDEAGEIWYTDFFETLSTRERNRSDDYEDEYFAKKAIVEGMPDNIQDFKNHPFYVLESHLKANEILDPKEHCGMIRTKGKNSAIKVYKRENVQVLRSPRAWYQRGRVLKPGERAMLVRKKNPAQMKDDDDDPDERLYSILQTSLYVPPPVEDGLITKNSYGNIDVYVPSMIPDGAVLIKTPYATDAAKLIGIDYAPAVVGFNFERRGATPKIDGIVVAEEFKDAIESVQEQLKAEAIEKQRSDLEIRALKGWALLLAKLRIKQRLNVQHGKVDGETGEASEDEFARFEKDYEEYLENEQSDDDLSADEDGKGASPEYGGGGFVVEDGVGAGGFVPDDNVEAGGFVHDGYEDASDSGAGGFISEDTNNVTYGSSLYQKSYPEESDVDNSEKEPFEEISQGRVESNEPMDTGGGFLLEDGPQYDPSRDDDDLYHNASESRDNRTLGEQNVQDGDLNGSGNEIDEYEAFFDQLQENGDEAEEEIDEAHDASDIEVEAEPIKVSETTGEPKEESLVSDTMTSESKEQPVEIEHDGIVKGNEPTSEEFDHEVGSEPATAEKQPLITEPQDAPTLEEYDDELEKEFNEQLKKEKDQSLSQSTQNGDEDYEFEYDSE